MNVSPLIQQNKQLLTQLLSLIDHVSNEQYQYVDKTLIGSSIGGHCRHIVDHYQSLLSAISSTNVDSELGVNSVAIIDYDARARDPELEINSVFAVAHIEILLLAMEQCIYSELPISVFAVQNIMLSHNDPDTEKACEDTVNADHSNEIHRQPSTLARELTFLHSHTTHHLAFIKILMNHQKIPMAVETDNIGLAPATLRHKEVVKCAR